MHGKRKCGPLRKVINSRQILYGALQYA
jgi:hypothetical protein